jgi:ribosomal-protein-alanine N-acetyltransferase
VSRGVIEQGRRVYLRSPRASDEDEFLRLVHASRSLHRPWVYPPETPREFAAFVLRSRSPSDRCLLVRRHEDDALVGVYTVSQIARGFFQNAYLGYYAFAPTAGAGLMADGLQLVLRHCFQRLKLHRLEANIQPGNERSKRLAQRAGFSYEGFSPRYLKIGGRWRDHERWAITREDWR